MNPIVNAGFEATVSKDNQYDKAFHHSSGTITSAIGSSHILWRPSNGSFFDRSRNGLKPFLETVVGTLDIHVHSLSNISREMKNVYIRLGCQLPISAQSGRWPRYHTKSISCSDKKSVTWNEGIKIGIVQYEDRDTKESLYPHITLSARSKQTGMFGSSSTLSKIATLNFDSIWNGPLNEWSKSLTVTLDRTSSSLDPLLITLHVKYSPIPKKEENEVKNREIQELARELALVSTYKDKVLMKPLKQEEIELFCEAEEDANDLL
mmetsp:Transcript_28992/g.49542  ORF Transcript_28992/g.49542 Transcript_28992/m.49542 type:complete len:264 (+) Transcript_28992:62-853(+)